MNESTCWCVYIEGMCLPWEDGLTEEDAKLYVNQFKSNGVMADAVKLNYTHKTRCYGAMYANS